MRILSERKLGRFGAKQRLLSIVHLSGAQVETHVHEIGGSDETLEGLAIAGRAGEASLLQRSGVLSAQELNAQKATLLSDA